MSAWGGEALKCIPRPMPGPAVYSAHSAEVRVKRALRAVVAAAGLVVAAGASGRAAEPGAAEIAAWIEELGSPQFARREAASKSLVAAGEPAVEPLVAAIRAGDLEVASRGIEILRDMLAAEPSAAAATAALDRCAETAGPAAARLAEAALSFHRLGLEAAARARLEELGAVVREPAAVEGASLEIEFGREWKGSGDDLRELTRLPQVTSVGFHGVPLDERALAILGRLEGLERLELFGTGLADEAIVALGARLVDTRIDVRRGGKLGVGALAFGGPCEIQTVQPGSAADQAGIRPGDIVLAVDGLPVDDFDGLTTRVAGRGPGEVVRLTVARRRGAAGDEERLEFEVRLDAW